MNFQQPTYKSIFDLIEETTDVPLPFVWQEYSAELLCATGSIVENEDDLNVLLRNPQTDDTEDPQILMKGSLYSRKSGSQMARGKQKYKKRRYALLWHQMLKMKKRNVLEPKQMLYIKNQRLEKVNDAEAKMYGLRLTGYEGKIELFTTSKQKQDEWYNAFKKVCVLLHISAEFQFDKQIGKGNFAKVHLGMRLGTIEKYAIKTIEKQKILENKRNMNSLEREISILRRLNHPNIIRLYEVYESDLYVHLIMEYLKGGELFAQIQRKGFYSEKDAGSVLKNLLEALSYSHQRRVLHRDLKPENLILADSRDNSNLKIADFGLATKIRPGILETLRCGSPGYVAPEILNNRGYNTKADIFSLGVILYILLSGMSPFQGKNYQEVLAKNKQCLITYPDHHWSHVSQEGKHLVMQMLNPNPAERFTAEQALEHPWFESGKTNLLSSALENMKKYHNEQTKNRFNLEKIKPEFSIITCTPLLNSKQMSTNSSLMESPFLKYCRGIKPASPEGPIVECRQVLTPAIHSMRKPAAVIQSNEVLKKLAGKKSAFNECKTEFQSPQKQIEKVDISEEDRSGEQSKPMEEEEKRSDSKELTERKKDIEVPNKARNLKQREFANTDQKIIHLVATPLQNRPTRKVFNPVVKERSKNMIYLKKLVSSNQPSNSNQPNIFSKNPNQLSIDDYLDDEFFLNTQEKECNTIPDVFLSPTLKKPNQRVPNGMMGKIMGKSDSKKKIAPQSKFTLAFQDLRKCENISRREESNRTPNGKKVEVETFIMPIKPSEESDGEVEEILSTLNDDTEELTERINFTTEEESKQVRFLEPPNAGQNKSNSFVSCLSEEFYSFSSNGNLEDVNLSNPENSKIEENKLETKMREDDVLNANGLIKHKRKEFSPLFQIKEETSPEAQNIIKKANERNLQIIKNPIENLNSLNNHSIRPKERLTKRISEIRKSLQVEEKK